MDEIKIIKDIYDCILYEPFKIKLIIMQYKNSYHLELYLKD